MTTQRWLITEGDGPIIATAIHAGHGLRPDVAAATALDEATRLREEDPYTDRWVTVGDSTIAVSMSRFEVDLNRPRDAAVYLESDDAWGLELWTQEPPSELVDRSLALYDQFYEDLARICDAAADRHERFVVLDLHSYNHRRRGPDQPVDDPVDNPEINVGTGSVDRDEWGDVVDEFIKVIGGHPFDGGHLDVGENIRFRGGHMSRWINARYPGKGCALAIEVKKIFMDEWTGEMDESVVASIGEAMTVAATAVRELISPSL